ncbi:DUF3883 domain-containing protein [Rhodanobacter umsongensis]
MLESHLRPSAIDGLIKLRLALAEASHLTPERVCELLRATYANAGVDYSGALMLHDLLPDLPADRSAAYRTAMEWILVRCDPPWLRSLRRGRDALKLLGQPDLLSCFSRAGVLDNIPSADALAWLDRLVSMAYAKADEANLLSGRKAERLSYEREKALLESYADAPCVAWVALDDSGAGYDIRSAHRTQDGYVDRHLEVKASTVIPARFFLTRHEWDVAVRLRETYRFHVWHLPSQRLLELTVDDVSVHVPIDSGEGRWQNAEIKVAFK